MSSLYPLGTEITLFYRFTDDGDPADPTTVTFTIELPDGSSVDYVFGTDPEVTNPNDPESSPASPTGYYELAYLPPIAGTYQYKVTGTGQVAATSDTGTFIVAGDSIESSWSVIGGPCEPWVSGFDVAECCGVAYDAATAPTLDRAAHAASELLYPLSGSQFSGDCTITVRPCAERRCWGPWDAHWANRPRTGCGCSAQDRIPLAGGVREIVEVLIDGEIVDPTTYEVVDGMWLDRINDPLDPDTNLGWPTCENRRLALTEVGTFGITYRYGKPVPVSGMLAAKELGCQVYLSCTSSDPADCQLPSGITRIDRQGITIELNGFSAWGLTDGKWKTGLPMVDAFLNVVNPTNARKLKAQVWSPDLWKFPRPVARSVDAGSA